MKETNKLGRVKVILDYEIDELFKFEELSIYCKNYPQGGGVELLCHHDDFAPIPPATPWGKIPEYDVLADDDLDDRTTTYRVKPAYKFDKDKVVNGAVWRWRDGDVTHRALVQSCGGGKYILIGHPTPSINEGDVLTTWGSNYFPEELRTHLEAIRAEFDHWLKCDRIF